MAPDPAAGIRTPPQHPEAEIAVLGAMMLTPAAVPRALEIVRDPAFFYVDRHRHLYAAMIELFNENRPVDMLTVTEKLRQLNRLDAAGGASYVSTLANSVPTAANLEEYARIVKEKYLLRELINATNTLQGDCYRAEKEAAELMNATQRVISRLASADAAGTYQPLGAVIDPTINELEEIIKRKGQMPGLTTGFSELDNRTLGMKPGELIILAARPSMGKTALALNIAVNAAKSRRDQPVLVFSLEMTKESLTKRLLCAEGRVNLHQFNLGIARKEDWVQLMDAAARLKNLPVMIDDSSEVSPLEMSAKARRLKNDQGLGLIIIDYLQLMTLGGRASENRVTEIAMMTRALKLLAKELEVPVMVLSQLSRRTEQREDQRPGLSDLRESGAIEQDADIVLFIYREEYYKREKCPPDKLGVAELIIGKQRNGPTGSFNLAYLSDYTRFENLAADARTGA